MFVHRTHPALTFDVMHRQLRYQERQGRGRICGNTRCLLAACLQCLSCCTPSCCAPSCCSPRVLRRVSREEQGARVAQGTALAKPLAGLHPHRPVYHRFLGTLLRLQLQLRLPSNCAEAICVGLGFQPLVPAAFGPVALANVTENGVHAGLTASARTTGDRVPEGRHIQEVAMQVQASGLHAGSCKGAWVLWSDKCAAGVIGSWKSGVQTGRSRSTH